MSGPKLLDQVTNVARLKHLSIRTEKSYRHYIKRFIFFHQLRHPNEMGVDEIRAFLSHLASDLNVAASTQNVASAALLFLYRDVLKMIYRKLRTSNGRACPHACQWCLHEWRLKR